MQYIYNNKKYFTRITLLLFLLFLSSCVTPRPHAVDNICKIFRQYPKWYWATQNTEKKWGVPINVQMAIIHQESRFTAKAKPPRTKLLWVIPWKRPSSAYGYTQALKTTWDDYKRSNHRVVARRDGFADAADFIGWYANTAYRKAGISRHDAYRLYLAYHEGIGGYTRRTYAKKQWLIHVAKKVNSRSSIYKAQLAQCRRYLKSKPWYQIW